MPKRHCAIVIGTTSNLTFALANVMMGIKKHSPDFDCDFIVYHKDITEKDKEIINNKITPTTFIEYDFLLKSKNNQFFIDRFTNLAFSRYECFNLLKEYKNVIWIDVDTLIINDISQIIEYAKETGFSILQGGSVGSNFNTPINGYNMNNIGCNSGVLVINEKLPEQEKLSQWCYNKTEELKEKVISPDQGIICLMIEEFNLEIKPLPILYNCYPIYNFANEAFILHTWGPEKFWNFYDNAQWDSDYKRWIEFGGTPANIRKLTVLQKFIYQKVKIRQHEIKSYNLFLTYMLNNYNISEVREATTKVKELIEKGIIQADSVG